MQFIEALKLRSKLFILFVLITIGLVSVAVMGSFYLNSMKKNIDDLYFGSLIPVIELNNIINNYTTRLTSTLHRANRLEISHSQITTEIESSLKDIEKEWKTYQSHFKRDSEMEYIEYADLEINKINNYFLKIKKFVAMGNDLDKLNMSLLENRVNTIYNIIEKLRKYEIGIANYERKKFLVSYADTKLHIGTVLALIIIAILIITLYIFKSIQKDHTRLEIATKKLKIANKKLENVSYTDSLTNLHNRRYFNYIYDREIKRAQRGHQYITFMMLDIDFFKQYNDTYGHIEGDHALKSVAKVLKDTLKRPSDYVFRLGGEEFGVLLSDTDESSSAKIAREICDNVRSREIKHEKSSVHEFMTISIGVVCCIADEALNPELLISRADEMLYEAKETGRDRYIITSNVSSATTQMREEEKESA